MTNFELGVRTSEMELPPPSPPPHQQHFQAAISTVALYIYI